MQGWRVRVLILMTLTMACLRAGGEPPVGRAHVERSVDSDSAVFGSLLVVRAEAHSLRVPRRAEAGHAMLRLFNRDAAEHHLRLVRLAPGHTPGELRDTLLAGGAIPAWAVPVGEAMRLAPASESTRSARLEPGEHVLLCDRAAPGGASHVARGMIAVLTVRPSSRVAPHGAVAGPPPAGRGWWTAVTPGTSAAFHAVGAADSPGLREIQGGEAGRT